MFPETYYADWRQQLEKDLKGKPWTDLQWHLGDDIVVDPFYHPDQYFPQRLPLLAGQEKAAWAIGESLEITELQLGNQEILVALEGGVEALELHLSSPMGTEDWTVLLENVQLEYITLNLVLSGINQEPSTFLEGLQRYFIGQGFELEKLHGSVDFGQTAVSVAALQKDLPCFQLGVVNGLTLHQGHTASAQELAGLLQVGEAYLAAASSTELDTVAQSILFKVAIGKSYFVEIAKLRALYILWFNVLKAYGVQKPSIAIAAHFAPDSQDENANTNMIRAATQAMSAIIGGAQELYVLPSNVGAGESPTPFSRRIARNVQHLLRQESYLDKVQDPAAGSFYVEKLTEELARKAWEVFQQQ
ncbi:MAG: methylmalonyl-CoA mutase family protein [Haliscomenobacter sp.]|uniref:methylmalonyl-CoA mutase family protein n=1 Tax=Haliscomenobacter sp. TaxID=2717303 RepID=UPI00299FD9A2|nr:methylmalonyl-CoA mutase family protein [Haliscomenobacter sp.]MDX2068851.1 methylmalonyl-CoA mutase family protein [Haliscomenobacter sp.]